MLSTRQLRYFDAIARHRHFGRAAEDCAVTQPALSMQIREMEEMLGVRLLERGRGGVRLTPVGEEAAARARGVLAALADMERTIRDSGRLLEGRLRLGVIASIAPYLLPRLLPEMARRYPGLEIALRESQTEHLVAELVQGDLDLVILSLPVEHPALDAMALFEDRFVLAVPEASADFPGPQASADSILAADLLLLEDGHCLRDQALNVCHKADARQLRRFGASSLATLAQLVANGQGITLLPDLFVRAEGGRMEGIRLLPFPDPVPARTIGLVWRRTLPYREDVEAVADMVKACRPGV
ncbi:UNVERIFIED_ORG: LysR family hydrogen peroxide-inducible transcriptional activator [Xanthobacter viscosus]|jgi:LysR family hydrogen peroxide-inducible transcriptional activator|uniref:LysR family transcriptional regulator n=1 Tax=Xanthobacter autotrophicus TaxID=280 RepID=A0A6C1KDB0_XANAU|nr:hydrogen peroxide-inducible genes activator [Xanthobacter autotrophicus]TLX42268.1 LysR family transcriptional regulator [Xanthobacter autotrophicus]